MNQTTEVSRETKQLWTATRVKMIVPALVVALSGTLQGVLYFGALHFLALFAGGLLFAAGLGAAIDARQLQKSKRRAPADALFSAPARIWCGRNANSLAMLDHLNLESPPQLWPEVFDLQVLPQGIQIAPRVKKQAKTKAPALLPWNELQSKAKVPVLLPWNELQSVEIGRPFMLVGSIAAKITSTNGHAIHVLTRRLNLLRSAVETASQLQPAPADHAVFTGATRL